jgi:ribosomal protein S18 acetylase RimI-like enzyme
VSPLPGAVATAAANPSSVILVAEEHDPGSAVVGYVSVKIVDTPRDPAMTPRRRAHVETVVVGKAHRARGTGTALMRAAAAWAAARDAAELVLTVWSDNRAAEALYQRLGYQPIARILRLPL